MNAFTPYGLDTVSLSATTTTGSVELNLRSGSIAGAVVRVYNDGPDTVFVQFGGSSVAATTSNMPVPSGAIETFSIGPKITHMAGITASGTATVYVTAGEGL